MRTIEKTILLGIVLVGVACATERTRVVEMAPIKIVTHRAPTPTSEVIDVVQEYDTAVRAYRAGDYPTAETHFRRVLRHFPKTKWGKRSIYNLGVVLKAMGKYDQATTFFETYLQCCAETNDDRIDAYLFLLECYEQTNRWDEALKVALELERLDRETPLSDEERLELYVRKGNALLHKGELDRAELVLLKATNLYTRSKGKGKFLNPYLGAAAYFLRGSIEAQRFDQTRIDDSSYEAALVSLNVKAQHLLNAQELFLLCINEGQPEWAAAAGFETGRMYEDFYMEIVSQKVPEFAAKDEESKTIYLCMMKEFIFGMLRKALRIYEEVVKLGERTDTRSIWIDRTRKRLESLREFYKHETAVCAQYRPAYEKPLKKYLERLKR